MINIPNGTVTFLFTDIEGSTKLAQDFPETIQAGLDRHHAIMRVAIESNNGFVFKIVGDAFCSAFEKAEDAVKAAVDAQLNLANEKWDEAIIKVRIGVHSGNAEWDGSTYMGYVTIARTQRVMSAAYGVQILISNDSYELVKYKFPESGKLSFRDLGERRLKDLIQPMRLFQVVADELPVNFPALKTLDARPNNLPAQLTSFIGREDEMRLLKELLNRNRLITLTGAGGSGKTRLALQIGAELIDDFENGVWFAELAAIFESALLPQTILKEFNLKEEPNKSPEDTLCGYLYGKEILIILDNCEHLIEQCARIAEKILYKCPKVKIIATSREALCCQGELTHRVLSLDTPDPKEKLPPEKLSQYEAVRLFIERALAVRSDFRVTNENAPALAEICYRLDGIPLAIELASARMKVLSVEKIYERINDRFRFLTGGKRTALPRQQTLRALIDWSYDLLSENEKALWGRLSVFSGGVTLDSAEIICSDEKIPEGEILQLLSQLAEKSIIIFDERRERYMILETIKQYGVEKLESSGESKAISSRHLEYFTELSEQAEPNLNGNEVHIWLDKLEAEHSNFRSAIEWSIKEESDERGVRLASALGNFWFIRGHYSIGRRLLENILEKYQDVNNISLGNVLHWAGTLAIFQGDYEKAQRYNEKNLRLQKENKNKIGIATTLSNLGHLGLLQGEFEKAKKFLNESLTIGKEIGDKPCIASSLSNLGSIAFFQGDYVMAKTYLSEGLPLSREIGNKRDITNTLITLGNLSYYTGHYEQAEKFYDESLSLSREMGNKRGIVSSLTNLGNVFFFKCEYAKAQKNLEESLPISREIGDVAAITNTILNLGNVAFFQGDCERGKKFYEECLVLSREVGNKREMSSSLQNLGVLTLDLRDYRKAKEYFKESLALRKELGDKLGIADTLSNLGIVETSLGNYDEAEKLFDDSLALFNQIENKNGYAYTLTAVGNLEYSRGNIEKAKQIYEESLTLNQEVESKREMAHSLIGLGNVAIKNGDYAGANKYFEKSLVIRRDVNDKRGISASLNKLGFLMLAQQNYNEAGKFFSESVQLNHKMNYKYDLAECFIGIAGIISADSRLSDAAKLLGNAEAILNSSELTLEADDEIIYRQITFELKEKLSTEELSKCFEEGKKMTLEEAEDLILNDK